MVVVPDMLCLAIIYVLVPVDVQLAHIQSVLIVLACCKPATVHIGANVAVAVNNKS